MDKFETKSLNIFRYLVFIKTSFKLMLKEIVEYKANFYTAIFEQFCYFSINILFVSIFYINFGDVIKWEIYDFILLVFIADFIHTLIGLLLWGFDLKKDIISGKLNNYINRPLDPFFCYSFGKMSIASLVYIITSSLGSVFVIFYFNVEVYNVLFFFSLLFLVIIAYFIFKFFLESINFFSFGLAETLIDLEWKGSAELGKSFPHAYFQNGKQGLFLLIFPGMYTSALLIPVLKGYPVWNFEIQLSILLSFIFIFGIGTWLNWHFGLKKYEAFG